MWIDLPISLLNFVNGGSLSVIENNKKTVGILFDQNKITIDIQDITFNMPVTKGIFTRLSEAREFASHLKKKNLTLCISNRGKIVMRLGKEANPKFSRLLTQSSAVEITDLIELRKLDKRLQSR